MRRILIGLISALLAVLLVSAETRAETSVDAMTIVRIAQEERGSEKKDQMPLLQYLGVDATNLADGNLSLHVYGWGRYDLKDKSFNDQRWGGELNYGYVQYSLPYANANLRTGRVFIREGIVNEQVDGVSAHTDLPYGFGISAFGGATVRTEDYPGESKDGKGDALYGGRLNYRYGGMLELGFSGLYESDRMDLTNPGNRVLSDVGLFGSRRLIGGDIWFSPCRQMQLMGHTSYNTETDGVAEHSYLLNINALEKLSISGEFTEYHERDLFYSSLMFSRLVTNLSEKSRTAGAWVSYEPTESLEMIADYRYYSRDRGDASRFGGDVRLSKLEKALRLGLGYHYLRSGPDFAVFPSASTSGSFHEGRAYAVYKSESYVASADWTGYFFRENIEGKSNAWEVVASLGYPIAPGLILSGDIGYGQNPQYDDEVKGLIRLTYAYKKE